MAASSLHITDVTPGSGPSGGGVRVAIAGRGFQLPTLLAANGPTAPRTPTMRVFVGARVAEDVAVLAADLLTCRVPAGVPGAADVLVQTLDDAGRPIDTALAAGAFEFVLSPLTAETDLTRLVRTLLQALKREVIPNVALTVQTDYDDAGGELHLAQLAELPGLVLVGPELPENRLYSLNALPSGERRNVPRTVDLDFTLIGVADHTTELLNLMVAAQLFFQRNTVLELPRDPSSPDPEMVRYELAIPFDGGLKVTSQPNDSNVRSFSGRFVIRGFDLEDVALLENAAATERSAPVQGVELGAAEPLRGREER